MTFDKIFKSRSHLRTERIGLLTASSLMHEKHFHKDAMSRGLQRVNQPYPNEERTSLWKATAQ